MPYPECKVYSGGSHYIAIPHTEKRYRPRPKKQEEKRLHQKKPNGVIPFGLIFLSVLSNFFSVDFRDTRATLATTNRQKISELFIARKVSIKICHSVK